MVMLRGVPISSALDTNVDAAIDFSLPAGAEAITTTCVERSVPLVMATTGLSEQQRELINAAAEKIAVVWAPNMSMAVNLTMKLAAMAAEVLKGNPNGADVEIRGNLHHLDNRLLAVWSRDDGVWRLLALQSGAIPPPAD